MAGWADASDCTRKSCMIGGGAGVVGLLVFWLFGMSFLGALFVGILIGAVVGSRNHFKGIMSIHIRFATLTFVKSCFG